MDPRVRSNEKYLNRINLVEPILLSAVPSKTDLFQLCKRSSAQSIRPKILQL